jgi:arsenate reductase
MGCGVKCPYIGRSFDDNWELEDPTGKSDADYLKVITEIQKHLKALKKAD